MRMFAFLACVTAMVVGRDSPGEALQVTESVSVPDTESVFVPATENRTKNLLELLLWQHGMHVANLLEAGKASGTTLETMSNTLLEMKALLSPKQELVDDQKAEKASGTTLETMSNTLLELKALLSPKQEPVDDQNNTCALPFMQVRSHCLLLSPQERMKWAIAHQYCTSRGSQMVILKDANTYAEFLEFIRKINMINDIPDIWVGASDSEVEGVWRWNNGDLVPSGPPFWGSANGYALEPRGGAGEDCGLLFKADHYYLYDIACTHLAAPFCEKI